MNLRVLVTLLWQALCNRETAKVTYFKNNYVHNGHQKDTWIQSQKVWIVALSFPFTSWANLSIPSTLLSHHSSTYQNCINSNMSMGYMIRSPQLWTSLVAQTVKRLSMMRETQVRSLGWEDPLEKEMAIHSSTIAWKIPWTEEPDRLQSMGSQRVGHD